MKVYGYVNQYKGENEKFLNGIQVDKIIHNIKPEIDFSFAEKDDLVIIKSFTSICKNLKEMLEFAQFIDETNIRVMVATNPAFDTRQAFGKLMISIWTSPNKYDDECFGRKEQEEANND